MWNLNFIRDCNLVDPKAILASTTSLSICLIPWLVSLIIGTTAYIVVAITAGAFQDQRIIKLVSSKQILAWSALYLKLGVLSYLPCHWLEINIPRENLSRDIKTEAITIDNVSFIKLHNPRDPINKSRREYKIPLLILLVNFHEIRKMIIININHGIKFNIE